jgi:hypothetical protein
MADSDDRSFSIVNDLHANNSASNQKWDWLATMRLKNAFGIFFQRSKDTLAFWTMGRVRTQKLRPINFFFSELRGMIDSVNRQILALSFRTLPMFDLIIRQRLIQEISLKIRPQCMRQSQTTSTGCDVV